MCRVTRPGQPVFVKHDQRAERLRAELALRGTALVNLFSSRGCGSTALLAALLARARRRGLAVAAFAALDRLPNDDDLGFGFASDLGPDFGPGSGTGSTPGSEAPQDSAEPPVRRLLTDGLCHLEPSMIDAHLRNWPPVGTRLLLVENAGEPSCPAPYDLGESLRVALTSVTAGEDRPGHSPLGFGLAQLVVVTCNDLAEAVDFDHAAFLAAVERVNPGVPVVFTSARRGDGLDRLLDLSLSVAAGARPHHPVLARPPAPPHSHGARASALHAHDYADAFDLDRQHAHEHADIDGDGDVRSCSRAASAWGKL